MRKYAIPKIAYVLLVLMIACLSIGYTYAYFSSMAMATNDTELGKINIVWRAVLTDEDDNVKSGEVNNMFNNSSSIPVIGNVKRGGYAEILALDKEGDQVAVRLQVSNSGNNASVSAFCRLKIEASYTPVNGTETQCDPGWIQLALGDSANKTLITEFDEYSWFYDEYTGYYYCGEMISGDGIPKVKLFKLTVGQSIPIANYIYLDNSAPSEIMGASINITLKLEGVQTTNEAYKQASVWGLNWQLIEN